MPINNKSLNRGILFCFGAYAIFSIQDAVMKWMVADFGASELLFWRSLGVLTICLMIGRKTIIKQTIQSPVIKPLMWCSLIVVLAVLLLNEKPTRLQWAIVFIGFVGVLIASRPGFTSQALSVFYALFSALLWAYTYILCKKTVRKSNCIRTNGRRQLYVYSYHWS